MITSSAKKENLDGEQRETSVIRHEPMVTQVVIVPILTYPLATNASAALEILASQRSDVTAPRPIAHIQHVNEIPHQFFFFLNG